MRIVIISTNQLFGECLRRGLLREARVDDVQFFPAPEDALDFIRSGAELNVLVDLSGIDAMGAVPMLMAAAPDICILALAIDDRNSRQVVDCARMGFHGFVPSDTSLEEVVRLILGARSGEVACQPHAVASMMRALYRAPVPAGGEVMDSLTPRKSEICRLVCEGRTNKEIALLVNRSVGTVKNHVHSILGKLDLPRRSAIPIHVLGAPDRAAPVLPDAASRPVRLAERNRQSAV